MRQLDAAMTLLKDAKEMTQDEHVRASIEKAQQEIERADSFLQRES